MRRFANLLAAGIVLVGFFGSVGADEVDWNATLPAADIIADLDALYGGLKRAHANNYANRSRAEYDAYFNELRESIDAPMRRFDAQLLLQRFAAFGNVAHARIEFPDAAYDAFRAAGGKSLPIYLRIVDGVAYVGENYSGNPAIRQGDEIVALDAVPMAVWLERVSAHISADTPYIAHSLLEFTFPRDLWAVAGEQEEFVLSLRRDAKPFHAVVKAATREAQQAAAAAQPSGFTLDTDKRSFQLLDDGVAYLRPGPFYNVENLAQPWENSAFVAFIDRAFEAILDNRTTDLVIDLRQNPGGDNSFSDPMLAWIADEPFRFCSAFFIRSSDEAEASNAARLAANPNGANSVSALFARQYAATPRGEMFEFDIPLAQPRDGRRYDGRVYVLVNRHSYSNAVNVAAMVQDYKLGRVVGEKTSDMATTYGAMEQFSLPNSGIQVGFPKAHIIRPSGDTRPDGVTPDWPIASPITVTSDDVVLEMLIAKIRSGSVNKR
ncbi:MAG: S41 family peptidase [Pseudomonadota bacterium]